MYKGSLLLSSALLAAAVYAPPMFGQDNTTTDRNLNAFVVTQWTDHKPDHESSSHSKTTTPALSVHPYMYRYHPVAFAGMLPVNRMRDVMKRSELSRDAFSMELWLSVPENLDVGVLALLKDRTEDAPPSWMLGYHNGRAVMTISAAQDVNLEFDLAFEGDPRIVEAEVELGTGLQQTWHHLVYTYNGTTGKLYWNGESVHELDALKGRLLLPRSPELEITGYADRHQHVDLADVLKSARLYGTTLSQTDVQSRFEALRAEVEKNL